MTFAESLQIALTETGGDFNTQTLQNLEQLGAFAGKPALRFIVSTAIKNGTFAQFATYDAWNAESHLCMERFIAHTGFQPRIAMGIFEAYASCLNWANSPNSANGPSQSIAVARTETDLVTHLNNHIEINREKEPHRGVTVEMPCVADTSARTIKLTATLKRTHPLCSATLNYALRTDDGTIITTGIAAVMTATAPSILPISVDLRCNIQHLDSILLYIN